jgi:hypothetical protein
MHISQSLETSQLDAISFHGKSSYTVIKLYTSIKEKETEATNPQIHKKGKRKTKNPAPSQ